MVISLGPVSLMAPRKNCEKKSKIWASALRHVGVVTVVSINEELEAAKAAKAAINTILTATPKSEVLATLKNDWLCRFAKYGGTVTRYGPVLFDCENALVLRRIASGTRLSIDRRSYYRSRHAS
jgi:hypothetical protein